MILKDFIDGGFPISRLAPVVCVMKSGDVYIAYSNYELKQIYNTGKEIAKCLGFWPGKKSTDCFILNPESYGHFAPPAEHKDIDSAVGIEVFINSAGVFESLEYTPGPHAINRTRVISKDKNLYDYVEKIKLRVKKVII